VLIHGGGADLLALRLPEAVQSASLVLEGLAIWAAVDSIA
jgi:type III pantothenate kinase